MSVCGLLVRAAEFEPVSPLLSCGWSNGAATENHYSIVVPIVWPRLQISDSDHITVASIFVLLRYGSAGHRSDFGSDL